MLKLLESGEIWRELARLRGRWPVTAAIAYANKDHLRLRASDTLICDASEGRVASGATTYRLLSALHERGVALWHLDRLHAKVVRLHGHVGIGSANMTANSSTLFEAAVVTDDGQTLRDVDLMLARLLKHPNLQPINRAFLQRIESIPVHASGRTASKVVNTGPATWLMARRPLAGAQETRSNKVVASLIGGSESVPPYLRVPAKVAAGRPPINLGDELMFVDEVTKRVGRPVKVTGAFASPPHVYYCHAEEESGSVAWARVQGVLKQANAYSRQGRPRQLRLDPDTLARLSRLFRASTPKP